jgi:hypothetical protein
MLWLVKLGSGDLKTLYDQGRPMVVKKTTSYFD